MAIGTVMRCPLSTTITPLGSAVNREVASLVNATLTDTDLSLSLTIVIGISELSSGVVILSEA